jgi:hypothetical protein
VNDRDWVGVVSNYLQQRFLRVCEALGQAPLIHALRINPPLAVEEAKYFLYGLEEELFRVDEKGCIQSELLPHPSRGSLKQDLGQIFAISPPPARLVRESICQLATVSDLVLQRGWPPSQVRMGTDDVASHGVDMIVDSVAGEILLGVEIKRSAHELEKFASDFRQCCKRGEHLKADCAFQQNHGMFEFCDRYHPTYLWVVAPGGDVCFKLSYVNGMIESEKLETLPRRSHIEFRWSQGSTENQ